MNFFDFITPEELAELPEEPSLAFIEFIRLATPRLRDELARWSNDPDDHYRYREAEHGFVNVTVAVARQFGIEPFASMDVPEFSPRGESIYDRFKFDVDHYVTQIAIGNAVRGREGSVALPSESRDRIRVHLHALRGCVEKSTMDADKRERLLRQLDGFENELLKRRVSFLAVTYVTLQVMALPGAVWGSVDIVNRLVGTIWHELGSAKSVEDALRSLPSIEPPKLLAPPRRPEEKPLERGGYGRGRRADLDDEIPF